MQDKIKKQSDLRVLVLGGDGMLGHQLVRTLSPVFKVKATLRSTVGAPEARAILTGKNTFTGVDVLALDVLKRTINDFLPDVVINTVGIIKQRREAEEAVPCIAINALFPHQLQQIVDDVGGRIIHLSTDCVFSGRKGNYVETDPADAEDLYGRSKLLGEITSGTALTLRTSMIGKELKRKKSLLEWFLSQKGCVTGYTEAIFSGLTTIELSRLIRMLLIEYPQARGLYHVAGPPINKHELLCLIRDAHNLEIDVVPDHKVKIDRSLDASRFRSDFQYEPPTWETMIAELAKDSIG